MGESDQKETNMEKVAALNTIFEYLVTDASDLVKDLYWSVKTYMFFGLITILCGVQESLYNIELLQ